MNRKTRPIMLLLFGGVIAYGPASAALAGEVVISQQGRRFVPDVATAAKGDTLVIPNDDEFLHHIYVTGAGQTFDSGEQPPGETVRVTLEEAGTYEVQCDIHPKMHLTVTVQ